MDIATNVKELLGKRLLCRRGDEEPHYEEIRIVELAGGEEGDSYVCIVEGCPDYIHRKSAWADDPYWITKDKFLRRFEIVEYLPDKIVG